MKIITNSEWYLWICKSMEERQIFSSLHHKNFKICCVHPVVATISWPIIAEFHCCPVHDPECLSWSSKAPQIWHHAANLWCQVVCQFFSNVSTTYCTENCPLLHCSQQEPSFLVIDYIRNDVLLDLLFQEIGQYHWTDQIYSCDVTIA
jgi:hypothetical protein